jgi:hypothetical protein
MDTNFNDTPDFDPIQPVADEAILAARPSLEETAARFDALRAEFLKARENAAVAALTALQTQGLFERFEVRPEGHGPYTHVVEVFRHGRYTHDLDKDIRQQLAGGFGGTEPSLAGFPAVIKVRLGDFGPEEGAV